MTNNDSSSRPSPTERQNVLKILSKIQGRYRPGFSEWLFSHWPEWRQWRASFYPLNRVGLPEDIAAAAVFFASDESEWISGETMVVAGGNPQTSNISFFMHEVNPLPDSVRGARP